MKLEDFVNLTKNKRNNQMSLNIKKTQLKKVNLNVKDILKLNVPISTKLKEFEDL